MGVAVPKNVANGTKRTFPFDNTVYVPSPGIVNVMLLQAAADVTDVSHNLMVLATSVVPLPAWSLVTGTSVCAVFHGPVDESFAIVGAGGMTGVNVDVTDCPKMSVILYVIDVRRPIGAFAKDVYDTVPVATSTEYVPSPAMVTGVVPQMFVTGSTMQRVDALNAAPPAAAAASIFGPVPVIGWNETVADGATGRRSGVATGGGGISTVGVMVAEATRPLTSATTYFTGDAVPTKVGNGSKVTVPFALTVYVPSPPTVSVVSVQLAIAVEIFAHKRTLLGTSVAGATAESLFSGEIV
jgi:hypothetical protein